MYSIGLHLGIVIILWNNKKLLVDLGMYSIAYLRLRIHKVLCSIPKHTHTQSLKCTSTITCLIQRANRKHFSLKLKEFKVGRGRGGDISTSDLLPYVLKNSLG